MPPDKSRKLVRITTVPSSLRVLLSKQLRFMAGYFEVLAISSPGQLLEEVQQAEGIRAIPVAMTRSITPLKDIKALWQLYRVFKKERPQIVHTHTPKAGLLGMLAARMAQVPVRLHTVAGLPLLERQGIIRRILVSAERLTYRCATLIYPNSTTLAGLLIKYRLCKPSKLKVLGNGSSNGIDTSYFKTSDALLAQSNALRQQLPLQPGDFVFIYIGRLVREKGIEELLVAFTELTRRHEHIKLLLVGSYEPDLDPLSAEAMQMIASSGAIIRADFQQDVRPWLLLSHVLVLPSYREGFPNVPMQAGCFQLPCIVTDINGCNEIIIHGKNGLIVPVKDSEMLMAAMENLLLDKQLYQALSREARINITGRYDQQEFWQLLLAEYQLQLQQLSLV